jgi:hypothetical protein
MSLTIFTYYGYNKTIFRQSNCYSTCSCNVLISTCSRGGPYEETLLTRKPVGSVEDFLIAYLLSVSWKSHVILSSPTPFTMLSCLCFFTTFSACWAVWHTPCFPLGLRAQHRFAVSSPLNT